MSDKQYSELIRERRSVRTFDGQGISDEILEQLRLLLTVAEILMVKR